MDRRKVDLTAPVAPANLRAAVTGNNNQIALTWSPVQDVTSGIDHYAVYRNGSLYATTTGTTYTDSSGISSQAQYSYKVAAVNYDGVTGAFARRRPFGRRHRLGQRVHEHVAACGFHQAVDPVSAQLAGNYQISGGVTVSTAALQSDDRTVLLTTSALSSASHTLTVNNVNTRTGTARGGL